MSQLNLKMFLIVMGFAANSYARPEYALRYNIVSCTVCHASPTGGGIRTPNGKAYGSHGYPPSIISEKAEWFQLDYRLEAFNAENAAKRKGIFTMTTIPSANLPVQIDKDKPPQMNFVTSYGLGRLDTGLGYTYLRYNLREDFSWAQHILVGRFNKPFGLMTDEHRMFTKISVPSSFRDYETGFMLSGTPVYTFHYDIAATNGTQGDQPSVDDSPWALYLNTRYMPFLGPVMVGASYMRNGTHTVKVQPEAINVYTLFSIEKLTSFRVPLILTGEVEWAHGWNNDAINSNMSNFVPASLTSYQTDLNNSRSQTLMLESDWYITQKWIALYRYEEFIPDTRYGGDKYKRNSFGMKYFLNGQSSLLARYEDGYATKPGMTEDVRTVGQTYYLMFHFWL